MPAIIPYDSFERMASEKQSEFSSLNQLVSTLESGTQDRDELDYRIAMAMDEAIREGNVDQIMNALSKAIENKTLEYESVNLVIKELMSERLNNPFQSDLVTWKELSSIFHKYPKILEIVRGIFNEKLQKEIDEAKKQLEDLEHAKAEINK